MIEMIKIVALLRGVDGFVVSLLEFIQRMHYIVYDDERILCLRIVKLDMALVFRQ